MLGLVLENSFVIEGFALLVLTVKIRENATKMRYVGSSQILRKYIGDIFSFTYYTSYNFSQITVLVNKKCRYF